MSEKKYIDADLLKAEFTGNFVCEYPAPLVKALIDNQPAADVAKIRHGKWICNTDDFTPKYRCSVCGYNKPIVAGENITQEPKNYCPNCGAKMDKE